LPIALALLSPGFQAGGHPSMMGQRYTIPRKPNGFFQVFLGLWNAPRFNAIKYICVLLKKGLVVVEAKNAPLPKIAEKGIPPSCDKACGPSDFYEGGYCDKNGCFEITAIASPTEIPGVTLVEAAPKFRGPLQSHEYPNPKSAIDLEVEMVSFANGNPDNWRDGVLERGGAKDWPQDKIKKCLSDFCDWQIKEDLTKLKMSQYAAGFSLWLKRQTRFDKDNQPRNGSPTNGNGQTTSALPRSLQSKVG